MKSSRPAYTLVEILTVLAIIAIGTGIVAVASAPARESARQQHCMSNLRQFGLAAAMYRADWDGGDAVPGQRMSAAQLGLPFGEAYEGAFLKGYVGDWALQGDCPDFRNPPYGTTVRVINAYTWYPDCQGPPGPLFDDIVAQRGEQTPLLTDDNHNAVPALLLPRFEFQRVLVLRLSGQAQNERIPARANEVDW
jgi:prepilin-type N-terminal cleavage/methylation domain-containing protein